MKALTLRRPWGDCVARFGKDIENRGWPPPRWLVGKDLAIHSGKGWMDDWDEDEVSEHDLTDRRITIRKEETTVSAIVAVVTVGEPVTKSFSPWFCGPVGWPLLNVRTLARPVPCRGAQGLWDVSPEVEAEIQRQLGTADWPAMPLDEGGFDEGLTWDDDEEEEARRLEGEEGEADER